MVIVPREEAEKRGWARYLMYVHRSGAYEPRRVCDCPPSAPFGPYELVSIETEAGVRVFRLQCLACNRKATTHIARSKLSAADMVDARLIRSDFDPNRWTQTETCERCGAVGVELHHWAPRAVFGVEEADKWPTSALCPKCHTEWHRRMSGYRP